MFCTTIIKFSLEIYSRFALSVAYFSHKILVFSLPGSPQSWDRFAYVKNNPIRYNDPTGHYEFENEPDDPANLDWAKNWSNPITYNLWDYVPIIANIKGILRGSQTITHASIQPGFYQEQSDLLGWYNDCYGMCHYANHAGENDMTPIISGPMPYTPTVDEFSSGMGEISSNTLNLVYLLATGKLMRQLPEPKINTPKFGMRFAPFGNADRFGTAPLVNKLPHFHLRIGSELGQSYHGMGWQWHYPWQNMNQLIKFLINPDK